MNINFNSKSIFFLTAICWLVACEKDEEKQQDLSPDNEIQQTSTSSENLGDEPRIAFEGSQFVAVEDGDTHYVGFEAVVNLNLQAQNSFNLLDVTLVDNTVKEETCSLTQTKKEIENQGGYKISSCLDNLADGLLVANIEFKGADELVVARTQDKILLDRVAPLAEESITVISKTSEVSLNFFMDDGENGSGVKTYLCQVEKESVYECTSPFSLNGVAGDRKEVKVQGVDRAGNKSSEQVYTVLFEKPVASFELSGPSRSILGDCSGPFLVQAKDETGRMVTLSNSLLLTTVERPSFQYFGDASCGEEMQGVSIRAGSSSAEFFLKGDRDYAGWITLQNADFGISNRHYLYFERLKLGSNYMPGPTIVVPKSIHWDGTSFYVSDHVSNRSLVYKGLPSDVNSLPDHVFHQPTKEYVFKSIDLNEFNNSSRDLSLWGNGNIFISTDPEAHRVLIWKSKPESGSTPADIVLGQTNFQGRSSGCGANKVYYPIRAKIYGDKLFVVDQFNNRVLVWNSMPTRNGQPADFVLGQANAVSCLINRANTLGKSANTLFYPFDIAFSEEKMFLSDMYNHRVLIWDTVPTENGQPATIALGQSDLVSGFANRSGDYNVYFDSTLVPNPSSSSLYYPMGIDVDSGVLGVVDRSNHRALVWKQIPTSSGVAADVVLGQASFDSIKAVSTFDTSPAESLNLPEDIIVTSNFVAITEYTGRSVVVHEVGGKDLTTNRTPERALFQHTTFGSEHLANAPQPFWGSRSISTNGSNFCVTSTDKDVVYVWNQPPKSPDVPADIVLGTDDRSKNVKPEESSASATNLKGAHGVACSGGKVAIADTDHNRVLVWLTPPSSDGAPADLVLGQANFSSSEPNRGGSRGATTLNKPWGVAWGENDRLFVGDSQNARVLVWDNVKSASQGQAADRVVGQLDFTSKATVASSSIIKSVNTLSARSGKLVVGGQNRILVWNEIPISNGEAADLVLGQKDFSTSLAHDYYYSAYAKLENGIVASDRNLAEVRGVWTDGNRIAVTDHFGHRVLVWNQWPTENYQSADGIIGQPDSYSTVFMNGAVRSEGLRLPMGVTYANGHFYVSDWGNTILVKPYSFSGGAE